MMGALTILHHRRTAHANSIIVQPEHLEMYVRHDLLHWEGKEGDNLIYDTRILLSKIK